MVDSLRIFADEVTRVAKEVGTEGKLGGQAEVPGVAGTWKDLTDNVNAMANSLTMQVRTIADVATAVTKGDLTRTITVDAQGELDELKKNINQMIGNLRETTERNQEQDWLKTNLAKFSRMMQGQKDLETVSRLIMSELTPLVSAHHGAFFIMDQDESASHAQADRELRVRAAQARRQSLPAGRRAGRPGGAREEADSADQNVPDDYIQITSGLGEAPPRNIIVLPILFEGEVKAVIELASLPAVQPDPPDLPRPAHRERRRRAEHDPGEHAHRGAARAVAEADAGAAEPIEGAAAAAGRAQALELGAGGAGPHARPRRSCSRSSRKSCSRSTKSSKRRPRCWPSRTQGRAEEPRGRVGAAGARGKGRAALALLEVQERIPGEHVARAAHAAQLAAHPRQAALREQGRQPDAKQVEFAQTISPRARTCSS